MGPLVVWASKSLIQTSVSQITIEYTFVQYHVYLPGAVEPSLRVGIFEKEEDVQESLDREYTHSFYVWNPHRFETTAVRSRNSQ